MNTTNRNYEVLYIVDATLADEQLEPIIAKYSKLIIDQGGEVQAAGKWDKRRLAYEVMGKREGTYILMYFTGESAVQDELDRVMRIGDDVMRHLITRVEPEHIDTSRLNQPQPSAEAPEAAPAAEAAEEPVVEAAAEEAPAPEAEATPAEEAAEEQSAAAEETAAEEPKAEE